MPFRNRFEHLAVFVPAIRKQFGDTATITIVEQTNNLGFRRGNLFNTGVRFLDTGTILVLHDVDHLPLHAEYWPNLPLDVFLPIDSVQFINMDGTPRDRDDIPSGYREFDTQVDDDFWGGVLCITQDAFRKVNGFNSLYTIWGKEEECFRNRCEFNNLRVARGEGRFQALPHPDSFPGLQDARFQENLRISSQWQQYLDYGYHTTLDDARENSDKANQYKVDTWVEVSHWSCYNNTTMPFSTIDKIQEYYEDIPGKHRALWTGFKEIVNDNEPLKTHRNWVVANQWGYGNRSLVANFDILMRELPEHGTVLEIGVFKGATLSLFSLLNQYYHKEAQIYGITPLDSSGDKYNTHPDIDYEEAIQTIYGQFELDGDDMTLIPGYSTDPDVIAQVQSLSPIDLLYIDGSHDYDVVVSDIEQYCPLLHIGGRVVIDDASCDLQIPDGLIKHNWRGLDDVTRAVHDTIAQDARFRMLYAIGHNKIFEKVA